MNGLLVAEAGDPILERRFAATPGENRVEIEIVSAQGPGRGVLQLSGGGFDPSSLRVAGGTAGVVSPGNVVARFRGLPGEKLILVFQSSP